MAPQTYRPEDLLNTHLDLLRGELTDVPADLPAADADLDELLAIAGLLTEALGTPTPSPAARAAARERFLAAMRHPHLTLVPPLKQAAPEPDSERPLPENVLVMIPRTRY